MVSEMEKWGVKGPVVGMHLGTTDCGVAVWKAGKVEIISDNEGNQRIPYESPLIVAENEDNITYALQKMKEISEVYLGCPVRRAVVAVPTEFDDSQRESTKHAGSIVNLDIIDMIYEPIAPALAYGLDLKYSEETNPKNVLIFDFGETALELTILEIGKDIFQRTSAKTDTNLGGQYVDNRLVDYFAEEFKRKHKMDITQCQEAMMKLKIECKKARKNLGQKFVERLMMDSLFGNIDLITNLTITTFESLNMELFEECMGFIDVFLPSLSLSKSDIDDVVLIGGSIEISMIWKMVESYFNDKTTLKSIDGNNVVALGAAIWAGRLGEHEDLKMCNDTIIKVHDVASLEERLITNRVILEGHHICREFKKTEKKIERDAMKYQLEMDIHSYMDMLDANCDLLSTLAGKFKKACKDVLKQLKEDNPNDNVDAYSEKKKQLTQMWEILTERFPINLKIITS